MVSETQRRELLGLALFALGVFTALSLLPVRWFGGGAGRWFPSGNLMGVLGAAFHDGGLWLLGAGLFLVPLIPILGGIVALRREPGAVVRWLILVVAFVMLVPVGVAVVSFERLAVAGQPVPAAGRFGMLVGLPLLTGLGFVGAMLLLTFVTLALFVAAVGWNPARSAAEGSMRGARALRARLAREAVVPAPGAAERGPAVDVPVEADEGVASKRKRKRGGSKKAAKKAAKTSTGAPPQLEEREVPEGVLQPPLSLLTEQGEGSVAVDAAQLDELGEVLTRTLRTFRVEGEIAGRTTGPVVTQYEFVPAPGIKVNRIAALDADLALALKAPSVRIVAPIPGKGAVGIEVPNPERDVVYLRQTLESAAFQRNRGHLPLALGVDLQGRPYVADLDKMPHLLIAGATGSGKSVCINTIVTSLVYRHPPEHLRLLMIDPKMVELSMYGDLPHLRHPVVTDPHDAAMVLKWAVYEMERRYELLSENGARSVHEFNRRVASEQPLRSPTPTGPEGDEDRWLYRDGPLPQIVVVVDELADLMMTVQAEIERPLAQLAQKARAIGIHLIVATQRPSVNVITGLIKANFPCRIAFRVSSKVDSRTILDQNGADALLGNGDMLFLPPGHSDPVRLQGAFVPTEDTERLMQWFGARVAEMEAERKEEDILESVRELESEDLEEITEAVLEDRDELFRQAAELCIQHQQGSTSLLQRRLRIGYGRAARIVDQLEHAGVLGPPDGSKPREVLVGLDGLDLLLAG
ncbi:MAG TPA: DNA translocase FtsK 4TM domain-containing protein [Longimicrobiales bacterium]|nr:DNA translocase FtsK 4TM domain-containing protein [Longimicrobiales bacterium]